MKNKLRYMGGVISQGSAIDPTDQTLSAFKFLDQINVGMRESDPTKTVKPGEKINIPFNFQVISLWKRNDLDDSGKELKRNVVLEIIDPKETVLQSIPVKVEIPLTAIRHRSILNVQGMTITTTGEYCVQFREVNEKDEKSEATGRICFDVVLNKS